MRVLAPLALSLCTAMALPPSALAKPGTQASAETAIRAAVAAPSRTPANRLRDPYRHPIETLRFFGVTPQQTVAEFLPGGGWYFEILAPLLRDHGTYIGLQPPGPATTALQNRVAADPALYGTARIAPWPTGDAVAPGSVDTVLTFRNIHNLVMNGTEEAAFATFYAMLKPGGTLGIVDHRLPEDRPDALQKTSGYLKPSFVRALAEKAGFVFVGSSEINANPKDSTDWPDGVWTLPPTLRKGEVDRAKYLAIGESDRMTLKFRKPRK
ncbi:class I SAM-dependent methyltransferase [Sphingobium subterraneum]|nr:class I SAM-dependent methyltransferase [Sphingobium subterraneum]